MWWDKLNKMVWLAAELAYVLSSTYSEQGTAEVQNVQMESSLDLTQNPSLDLKNWEA